MKNFTYFRPTTAEQAVGLLEATWGNTALLAGGTDLLDLQKEYIAQPGRVVSLGGIGALGGITVEDKQVKIGAGTKLATTVLRRHRLVELFLVQVLNGLFGEKDVRAIGNFDFGDFKIEKDGKELVNHPEPADGTSFDCYGSRDSIGSLEPGSYVFTVVHNADIEATGNLTVSQ